VYLRQTKRKNKDGSSAHYLQLAHNVRDPDSGVVKAKILHSFGRAEHLEREALERLIASIARYLDQDPPLLASSASSSSQLSLGSGEVEALDARDLGGAWVLDQLWRRLGIDTAVKKVAKGRKLDAARLERVLFALVASRALAPSSKLEVTRWVTDDVHINGLDGLDADQCYRAMDFLLEALAELQETVFYAAADLLNLSVDLVFFDTTSTYFELDFEDGELDDDTDDESQDPFRLRGHSKDSRPDLPQVVIGMAVTTGGLPVRLWVWPGNTTDASVLQEVKADLAGWQLNRTVWIADAGFASKDNRKVLTQGGSGFIVAERLRGSDAEVAQARSRQGRFRKVDEHLEVKDIIVGDGPSQAAVRDGPQPPAGPSATPTPARGSSPCSRHASMGPMRSMRMPVRSCVAGSGRSRACGATCASPPPGCCASTGPSSPRRPRPTAAPCSAPVT
jgi:hypothetical protein